MAKNTATHYGTCQGCGCKQKLPCGVLAKHGYTVQWGFFQGTCNASGELPFEESCDFCKKCIVNAKAQLASVRESAERLRRPITEPVADRLTLYMGYDKRTFKSIRRAFTDVRIKTRQRELSGGHVLAVIYACVEVDGVLKEFDLRGNGQPLANLYSINTPLDAAAAINEREAKDLDRRAQEIETYVKWQQDRVDNWKPGTLKAVAEEAKRVNNAGQRLLQALADASGPKMIPFFSRGMSRTRNGQYAQARKLADLGLVKVVDVTGAKDWRGEGLVAEITEAGRAALGETGQE